MKVRRQRLDLRSFLGTEVPLQRLDPDLRQRVRHALAEGRDLPVIAAEVARELVALGLLRPVGTVHDGGRRVPVYGFGQSERVYDLQSLLRATPPRSAPPAQRSQEGPEASPPEPVSPPPSPSPSPGADVRPSLEAIRRTVARDWVSHGIEASLEVVLTELARGLRARPRLVIWPEAIEGSLSDGEGFELAEADDGFSRTLQGGLERAGIGAIELEGWRWIPVRRGHELIAALGTRPEEDVALADAAAATLSELFGAHGRSQRHVFTDPLTGLHNRRFFETQLGLELERAQRLGQPLALLFVDIDHFKKVNDRHGHDVGDLVLQHVARLMVQHLRRIDQIFRWGGEEFALILPATGEAEARFIADRLRGLVATSSIAVAPGQVLQCTISVGVALAPQHAEGGPQALLRRADQALYRAKESGRNRVVVFGDAD